MRIKLLALLCVLLTLGALFLVGCNKEQEQSSSSVVGELKVPTITIDADGIASWGAIEGAVAYEYKINDGKAIRVEATITKIKVVGTESISVRAIGDGKATTSSAWSEPVRASVPQLAKPTLSVQIIGDMAFVTWEKDEHALSYKYRLNAEGEKTLDGDALGMQIGVGDTLYVCAIGDGISYLDSDWAIVKPE